MCTQNHRINIYVHTDEDDLRLIKENFNTEHFDNNPRDSAKFNY